MPGPYTGRCRGEACLAHGRERNHAVTALVAPLAVIPDILFTGFERSISVSKNLTGVLLVVTGMLLVIPGSGQIGGTGSIRGVVSDPSGAVIPAASVVATNIATRSEERRVGKDGRAPW